MKELTTIILPPKDRRDFEITFESVKENSRDAQKIYILLDERSIDVIANYEAPKDAEILWANEEKELKRNFRKWEKSEAAFILSPDAAVFPEWDANFLFHLKRNKNGCAMGCLSNDGNSPIRAGNRNLLDAEIFAKRVSKERKGETVVAKNLYPPCVVVSGKFLKKFRGAERKILDFDAMTNFVVELRAEIRIALDVYIHRMSLGFEGLAGGISEMVCADALSEIKTKAEIAGKTK